MVLAVRLRSAVVLAGRYPLLAGVDLDVRAGEVVVVRGANGAGKTSLLRAMAGLVPLAEGDATVLGLEPWRDVRALRRLVGLLGHRNGLYDDLTAQENVRFAVRAAGLSSALVPEALATMGLTGRLARLPASKLSAGQRRRVALASLIARQPRLWLLDEPHAGLDSEFRAVLDDLLRSEVAQGATVVLASHEVGGGGALADRFIAMAGGTVVGGTLDERAPDPAAPGPTGAPPELPTATSHVA
jgi:ABC-2 type transport system ATP-binding protein